MPLSKKARSLIILAVTAGYWLLIFGGTHASAVAVPVAGNWDKLAHGGAFAGLAFLLCGSLACFWRTGPALYASAVAVVAGYGVLDEVTQMLANRTPDPWDWLADLAGAMLGTLAFAAAAWIHGRRRPAQGATG